MEANGAFKKLLVSSYSAVVFSLRSCVVSLYQVNVLFVFLSSLKVSGFLKLSFSEVRCFWCGCELSWLLKVVLSWHSQIPLPCTGTNPPEDTWWFPAGTSWGCRHVALGTGMISCLQELPWLPLVTCMRNVLFPWGQHHHCHWFHWRCADRWEDSLASSLPLWSLATTDLLLWLYICGTFSKTKSDELCCGFAPYGQNRPFSFPSTGW